MLSDFIVLLILSVHNLFDLESYFHFLFVSVHYLKFPHILSSFFFCAKNKKSPFNVFHTRMTAWSEWLCVCIKSE